MRHSYNRDGGNEHARREFGRRDITHAAKSWDGLSLADNIPSGEFLLPSNAHVRNTAEIV